MSKYLSANVGTRWWAMSTCPSASELADGQKAVPTYLLQKGVALIWHNIRHDSETEALRVLSAQEIAFYESLLVPERRRMFACGRAFLRHVLGSYLAQEPKHVPLIKRASGKPALKASVLEFNLSHTGQWIVCAVTQGCPVGIDIEQIRPLADLNSLARQVLSEDELIRFSRLPLFDQYQMFFTAWTQHEARFKVGGSSNVSLMPLVCPPGLIGHIALETVSRMD